MTDLTLPIYNDENAARKHLETIRWGANGVSCPYCGSLDAAEIGGEKSLGDGWYHCPDCRKKFTVRVGTVYERSHIALHKWVLATHLMAASKKGISAHQLHRMLGITYKSAWFMAHRIREAMAEYNTGPLGGEGKVVEIDETYIGGLEKNKHRNKRKTVRGRGGAGKQIAFAIVERGGKVRSHHIASVSAKNLRPIVEKQIHEDTTVMSDTGGARIATEFKKHGMVNHGIGEYVRGEVSTNTVESYFSVLKRGITGTYHHVSEQHLKRYLAEFDFRHNERAALKVTDDERAIKIIKGAEGKRVTYRRAD